VKVTALRIGHSAITLDWSNLGIPPQESEGNAKRFESTWNTLKSRFQKGEVGFYDSPVSEKISQSKASEDLAHTLLSKKTFTDCLFLGIGGSSLGPLSLLNALKHKCKTGVQFHIIENCDALDWKYTLSKLKPESTLICVVTKSGSTFETLSQFLIALDWIGPERLKTHVVAITDPEQGDLRAWVNREGIMSLPIDPSLGGRFSIFSPVGLFPAALAGLSVTHFMTGATHVREYIEKTPLNKNPIFILGHHFIENFKKHPIHVCMPYSTLLKFFGAWVVQLWAESLGKDGKGFTPLAAVGASDQHSILQLLRDGPDDKITFFIAIDEVEDGVKIPMLPSKHHSLPAFKILEGHTLHELLNIECQATSLVLTRNSRPNFMIRLDRLDEKSLGALYYFFACLTAITGTLWDVNPFNQPGVEEGKVYIRDALLKKV
jgi:glucose-6-phosphate isomerase